MLQASAVRTAKERQTGTWAREKAVLTSHIMITIECAYVCERSDTGGRPRQQSLRHRVDHSQRGGERGRETDRARVAAGCATVCVWVCVWACESEKHQHCAEHWTQAPITLTGTAHPHNQEALLLMLWVPNQREKKMRRGGDKRKEREVKKRKRVCLWDYIVPSQEPVCVQLQTAVGHAYTHSCTPGALCDKVICC